MQIYYRQKEENLIIEYRIKMFGKSFFSFDILNFAENRNQEFA